MASTTFKPAGLPVRPPHADPDGDCVVARLAREQPHRVGLDWPEGFELGVAHRLDVSTSGALWLADTPEELPRLRALFAGRHLRKTYVLRAAKDVPWDHHEATQALAHARRRKRRMVVRRGANTPHRGRWFEAHTTFDRLGDDLWRAVITTGVTHQIRVHAAFLGLPLLGDRLYGGGPPPDDAPEGVTFFLHHVGLHAMDGPERTDPVPLPRWAVPGAEALVRLERADRAP